MRWLLIFAVACGAPPPPQPPQAVTVDYELHGQIGEPPRVERDQPPNVKLKLGHFRNVDASIGATIDLLTAATDNVADVDPAKLRFDGEDRVWLLAGQRGGGDRIDYLRDEDHVLLQVFRDGHMVVFVPDPMTDRASDGIALYRDGDADPL